MLFESIQGPIGLEVGEDMVYSGKELTEALAAHGLDIDWYDLLQFIYLAETKTTEQYIDSMIPPGDDWEALADGYRGNFHECLNEVEAMADYLDSGKRKYTKSYIARELRKLREQYFY